MKKPPRALVVTIAIPFLGACMGTQQRPLPEPAARSETSVRGVVLGDSIRGEGIEFGRVESVEWTDSTIAITGVLKGSTGSGGIVTRSHRLSDVAALLVREVDANRTSILVGAVIMGVVAVATLLLTGKTNEDTVF